MTGENQREYLSLYRPGVRNATVFGQSMHLLVDERVNENEIRKQLAGVNIHHADIRPIGPSLEDVFVALTTSAGANGGGA